MGSEATIDNSRIVWRNFTEIERSIETITQSAFNYYTLLEASGYPRIPAPAQPLPLLLYSHPDKKTNYMEHNLQFSFQGRSYLVRIDEIWKNGKIVTNGLARVPPKKKELETDLIYTLQALAYCIKARESPSYRMAWGLDSKFLDRLDGQHLAEGLEIIHSHLYTGEQFATSRSDDALGALESQVSGLEKKISKGEKAFPVNHNSCYVCRFNAETSSGGVACRKANTKYGPMDYALKNGKAIYGIKLSGGLNVGDRIREILAGLSGEESLIVAGEEPSAAAEEEALRAGKELPAQLELFS